MTVLTAPAPRTTDARLRSVLRTDAVVTGLVGAVLAVDSGPVSRAVDLPRAAVLAVGLLVVAVALEMALASRWEGRRLRLAATVTAELAVAWVVASAVLLVVRDTTAAGTALVVGIAAVTAGFAAAYVRVLRR